MKLSKLQVKTIERLIDRNKDYNYMFLSIYFFYRVQGFKAYYCLEKANNQFSS